jgi:hypothetical protein
MTYVRTHVKHQAHTQSTKEIGGPLYTINQPIMKGDFSDRYPTIDEHASIKEQLR